MPRSAASTWRAPYSAAACAKSSPCGVATCSLEVRALARDRQEVEDPAAVVVDEHDRERRAPSRCADSSAAEVVGERDVADVQDDRAVAGRGGAERGRDRAVDPVRAAVGEDPRRRRRARRRTSRGRGSASRRRRTASPRRGSASTSSAATRGSLSSSPSVAAIAPAAARSAPRQRSSHAGSPASRCSGVSAASVARGLAAMRAPTTPAGSCHAPSASSATCSASSSPASHARSGFEVGRSPIAQHELGRAARRRAARRAAARRSGRSRPVRGARPTAGRRAAGSARRRRTRRRASPSAGSRSSRPATITARGAGASGTRRQLAPAPATTGCGDPRPAAGAAAGARVLGRQRRVEHERLAQREVEVHRARAGRRARSSTARHASARIQRTRSGVASCVPTSTNHLAAVAVELDLVDRLAGADVAQLGRAVGGQHEQRHARLRAPRSRPARSSAAAVPDVQATATGRPVCFASPSAKKPATRSSTCDHARRPRRARERQHERRRARAGRGAGVGHAAARELLAEGAQQQVGVAWRRSWKMRGMAPETIVLLHGFTQTGRSWEPTIAALGERYRALAPDIRGHGSAADARPVVVRRRARRRAGARAGALRARAATRWAGGSRCRSRSRRAASASSRLVLSAPRPGSPIPAERRARRAADEALADRIEGEGIEAFAREWAALPLFAGQPAAVARRRARRRACAVARRPRRRAARPRHRRDGAAVGAAAASWRSR